VWALPYSLIYFIEVLLMLPKTAMQKTATHRSGPNFIGLRDREQDPMKLFKKHHIVEANKLIE
jgi:hypothetical protein